MSLVMDGHLARTPVSQLPSYGSVSSAEFWETYNWWSQGQS